MLKLLEIDSETLYNTIMQAVEIAIGEPLYPGDERRIFTEAMIQLIVAIANSCNTACNGKMLAYAEDDALDALGERMGVERIPAVTATATFEFTLTEVQSSDITIPAGTQITTDGDVYFATDSDLVIEAGDLTGTVTASCTEAGEDGNGYSIGSIAQLVDSIDYVLSAINTTASSGGVDEEDDEALRDRIKLANSTFSTAGPVKAYQYYAKSADVSIIDVYVTSPSPCVVYIYPLCEGGALPSADIISAVTDICSADDVRPLTDQVTVLAPTQVSYDITVTYYTTAEDEEDCVATIEGEGGAIDQYIEWQAGALGRDINPDKLLMYMLNPLNGTGCIRASIASPTVTTINANEVAKVGTITVTHEVVS